jgi:hypothetical protein
MFTLQSLFCFFLIPIDWLPTFVVEQVTKEVNLLWHKTTCLHCSRPILILHVLFNCCNYSIQYTLLPFSVSFLMTAIRMKRIKIFTLKWQVFRNDNRHQQNTGRKKKKKKRKTFIISTAMCVMLCTTQLCQHC